MMWNKHKSVIPDKIHEWRGKHWPYLQKLESREGDAIRISNSIKNILSAHERLSAEGKLNPKRLYSQARGIELFLSELTDEVLRAQKKEPVGEIWNKTFVSALNHWWRLFPADLKEEIKRQIES